MATKHLITSLALAAGLFLGTAAVAFADCYTSYDPVFKRYVTTCTGSSQKCYQSWDPVFQRWVTSCR